MSGTSELLAVQRDARIIGWLAVLPSRRSCLEW